MGVLKRVNSLPTFDVLSTLPDATWPQEKQPEERLPVDLQSITSESSVADILQLLQEKRGARGATVHGSNVWELMKAAAEAKENARLDEISVTCLKPQANDFMQCSDDMWTWETATEGLDPIDEAMEEVVVPPEIDSDAMWQWDPPIADAVPLADDNQWWMWRWETKDPDEASATRVGCAKIDLSPAPVASWLLLDKQGQTPMPDTDEMWDWSASLPANHAKKAALIWDWAWRRPEEEPETSVQMAARAKLMWDWSWHRDENKADEAERLLFEEEKAEVEKTVDMWDWSMHEGDTLPQYARETLLWDWGWQRDDDGAGVE